MYIPKEIENRKKVLDLVNDSVRMKNEIAQSRLDMQDNALTAEELYAMTKSDFNKLVNTAYDVGKVEDKIEDLSVLVANFEILIGKREPTEDEVATEEETEHPE